MSGLATLRYRYPDIRRGRLARMPDGREATITSSAGHLVVLAIGRERFKHEAKDLVVVGEGLSRVTPIRVTPPVKRAPKQKAAPRVSWLPGL